MEAIALMTDLDTGMVEGVHPAVVGASPFAFKAKATRDPDTLNLYEL